jgi:hypothetical protein
MIAEVVVRRFGECVYVHDLAINGHFMPGQIRGSVVSCLGGWVTIHLRTQNTEK